MNEISAGGIYKDLMRKFSDEGHKVYIASPTERRYKEKTKLIQSGNILILNIKIFNIQKTNLIEKGLSTVLIDYQYLKAVKEHFSKVHFDMILYSTPPITFSKVIQYVRQKDKAISYLLLKDIFPQNAVDLGMIKKDSLLHRYFRKKERKLYSLSDHIGCMSQANVDYVCKHNPDIAPEKLEVNPNSIEPKESYLGQEEKLALRRKYHIPLNETVFVFGGNLGKPQGINFLLETLHSQKGKVGIFFIVSGSGTEYPQVRNWFNNFRPEQRFTFICTTEERI